MNDAALPRVIAGLGEILWDVFPEGPRFGGAPANFSCNVAGLAGKRAEVIIVSGIGTDAPGTEALTRLQSHGVQTAYVQQSQFQTGRVEVLINDTGDASYEFADNTAWDNLEWSDSLKQTARRTAAVCFGTLGQRASASRDVIRKYVAATRPGSLRVFDINLRAPFWTADVVLESLPLANVLKCNEEELPVLGRLLNLQGTTASILDQIGRQFDYQVIALTRGPRGSVLWTPNAIDHIDGMKVNVADTVGAGDAFTAAIVLGILEKRPLDQVHRHAAEVAAYVCSQTGATPHLPSKLQQAEQDPD